MGWQIVGYDDILDISVLPSRKRPSLNLVQGNEFCATFHALAYFQSKEDAKIAKDFLTRLIKVG